MKKIECSYCKEIRECKEYYIKGDLVETRCLCETCFIELSLDIDIVTTINQCYGVLDALGNHLLHNEVFMSPTDIAKKYGKSRQWWNKLMRQGRIKYQQTSAGKITLESYVVNYLNKRKE